jgi:hypothetical protein
MKGKIKGCTHHESKVLKMAGGGTVLNTYSKKIPYMMAEPKSTRSTLKTMGPPNVKEVQKRTDKNSDGSQQYVRGTKTHEKLGTLINNMKALEPQTKAAERKVKEAHSSDDATFKKALDDRDRVWSGDNMLTRAFIDEVSRKKKK